MVRISLELAGGGWLVCLGWVGWLSWVDVVVNGVVVNGWLGLKSVSNVVTNSIVSWPNCPCLVKFAFKFAGWLSWLD